jgi:prolyl oligopeptidase
MNRGHSSFHSALVRMLRAVQSAAMKSLLSAFGAFLFLLFVGCATQTAPPSSTVTAAPVAAPAPQPVADVAKPNYPVTAVQPVTETLHGIPITDPYRWLEDQNSPATRDWIRRQNAFTDQMLAGLPGKAELAKRVEELLNVDSFDVPFVRGNRFFYEKRKAGEDLYSIYMREGLNGAEQLLIDAAPLNPKHTTNIGIEDVSHDGHVLAYYVREGGADEVEVRFYDVDAKRDTGTPLAKARYEGISITPDDSGVYYTAFVEGGPRVFRRRIQSIAAEKLFGDGYGPEKIISSELSGDGHWLLVHVLYGSAAAKTEVYLKNVVADSDFVTVVNDVDARFFASFAGDQLAIETNWNAPNGRVMVADAANPSRANWRELVPEQKEAAIQAIAPVGGKLFVRYIEQVKPRIAVYGLDGKQQSELSFPTIGTLGNMTGNWSSPTAFYSFSSFHIPKTIYAYNVVTGERTLFARQSAPVNADDFNVEQLWFNSKDGTRVPMFVMYRKGLQRDGSHPTYLTGYGGFNSSQLPQFSPRAINIAEHGGVYALVNLRGGAEFGEAWHKAGMGAQKQNTFDDFIAAAEYLIREKYTSPAHLAIGGTSNGGLLVTAAVTQRPELFRFVYVGYPLVDMLRYDQFLVGSFWVPEYGSAKDPQQFRWIFPYSPYQHVVPGTKYPTMFLVSGDADTRVAPLHARKMTALMQAATGSANPVLLRYHTSGGHSGGEPLAVQVNNEAELLAFLLRETR